MTALFSLSLDHSRSLSQLSIQFPFHCRNFSHLNVRSITLCWVSCFFLLLVCLYVCSGCSVQHVCAIRSIHTNSYIRFVCFWMGFVWLCDCVKTSAKRAIRFGAWSENTNAIRRCILFTCDVEPHVRALCEFLCPCLCYVIGYKLSKNTEI